MRHEVFFPKDKTVGWLILVDLGIDFGGFLLMSGGDFFFKLMFLIQEK